ncbi:hypothetical protein X474_05610 [Dethiosulfatarculus sandiegensis]|uniref:Uncharacterized protein n=1 Tax=Dethiosulfatarculus sandiegensis TaxID=1429043 RepID=A0A0D2JZW0_9BACT|nr:hypothetical protein X474_05610 [Dethiosulfatarculus sandiegensis]
MEIKCLVQKAMSMQYLEKTTHHLNSILAECERVEGLEKAVIRPDQEAA